MNEAGNKRISQITKLRHHLQIATAIASGSKTKEQKDTAWHSDY